MLDKKKRIRLMVRMASYEKTNAKQDQKISSYYKKRLYQFKYIDYDFVDNDRICNYCWFGCCMWNGYSF